MTLYLLDTDHFSLYQRGHAKVKAYFEQIPPTQIAISIITAEELLRGRLAQIRAAKTEAAHIQACFWLAETLDFLKDFQVLPYAQEASRKSEVLRHQKLRVGTQDLRIAAVALAVNALLVTANQSDFASVAGLQLQDWTK